MLTRLKRLSRLGVAPHDREDRIALTAAPGAPPGTLTMEPGSRPTELTVFAYGAAPELVEESITDLTAFPTTPPDTTVTWVNVDGLEAVDVITGIGKRFGVHKLTLEDVVHVDQRAKVEVFPTYLFVVVRMAYLEGHRLVTEQLAIIVGDDYVVTFQEGYPRDCLDPVRDRLRNNVGSLRRRGPGYLAYALIDAVTDQYFEVLAGYGDLLDELEHQVLDDVSPDLLRQIHGAKRELLTLKRTIVPHFEAVKVLARHDGVAIDEETKLHLRDVHDHARQQVDIVESYRETASNLISTFVSLSSHHMNEVMKMLTVVGSLFIPLTFITGLYGMNFQHMPELRHPWAYPAVLGVMLLVTLGLLAYFARRGWIGSRR